jgi:RND family efflux transporter MFP subunit
MIGMVILLGTMPRAMAQSEPVAVNALPVEQLLINAEASAPATVLSLGDSRISAEINARVVGIPVRVGEIVEPGAILVRLECGDYLLAAAELEAMLAGTEARIDFAGAQLRRVRSLQKNQTVSKELLEQRQSELAGLVAEGGMQRARLGTAKRHVTKCLVGAPFRAAVVERLVSVGEYAMPGSPLIRVLDVSHLEVSADVIVRDAEALLGANAVVFRHNGEDHPVALRALVPMLDPTSGTREVRLAFKGEGALTGARGRLIWRMGPALPADLLVRRGQRIGVLLAEGGRARFHPLPGAQEGRPASVALPAESLIITAGRFALETGDAIRLAQ